MLWRTLHYPADLYMYQAQRALHTLHVLEFGRKVPKLDMGLIYTILANHPKYMLKTAKKCLHSKKDLEKSRQEQDGILVLSPRVTL